MMISKIADRHLSREAFIYIRQSTMGQVRFNQESTERQYNLASKAQALGWSSERIRVLDRDLGQSGARTTNREDFKTLVSDVAMSQVGAIFSLEASRLARSNQDWHRLLEALAHQQQSSAIPEQKLDAVGTLGTEHQDRAGERVLCQR